MMASFRSPEQAGQAVSAIIRSGLRPVALELLDELLYSSVERSAHMNLAPGAGVLLIADVEGFSDSLAEQRTQAGGRLSDRSTPWRCAWRPARPKRGAIWYAAESAFAATAWIAPGYRLMTSSYPAHACPKPSARSRRWATMPVIGWEHLAHAGDGNIHPEDSAIWANRAPSNGSRAARSDHPLYRRHRRQHLR